MDFEQFKEIMMCKLYLGFSQEGTPDDSISPALLSSGSSRVFSKRRLSRLSSIKSNAKNASSLRNSMA